MVELPGVEHCNLAFTDQPMQVCPPVSIHTSEIKALLALCDYIGAYLTKRRLNTVEIARMPSVRDVAFMVELANSTFGLDMCPSDERISMLTWLPTSSVLIPTLGAELVEGPGERKPPVSQVLVKRQ